jgi:hypothetical protein
MALSRSPNRAPVVTVTIRAGLEHRGERTLKVVFEELALNGFQRSGVNEVRRYKERASHYFKSKAEPGYAIVE